MALIGLLEKHMDAEETGMASSRSRDSAAARLLRDLVGAEDLVARLEATAQETCDRHGGAQAIVADLGGVPCCVGYWRLECAATAGGVAMWEATVAEHQARHRVNVGR